MAHQVQVHPVVGEEVVDAVTVQAEAVREGVEEVQDVAGAEVGVQADSSSPPVHPSLLVMLQNDLNLQHLDYQVHLAVLRNKNY